MDQEGYEQPSYPFLTKQHRWRSLSQDNFNIYFTILPYTILIVIFTWLWLYSLQPSFVLMAYNTFEESRPDLSKVLFYSLLVGLIFFVLLLLYSQRVHENNWESIQVSRRASALFGWLSRKLKDSCSRLIPKR